MNKKYSNSHIITNVLALCRGLSIFSDHSRVALILKIHNSDTPRLYDPNGLLAGSEKNIIKSVSAIDSKYLNHQQEWISNLDRTILPALDIPNTINFGCSMKNVAMQYWIAEKQFDLCSTGPIIRWLEFAAGQLNLDLIDKNNLREDISNFALQSYSTHAIRDYVTDIREQKLGMDSDLSFYPILDTIIGIANTKEEGAWARG